MSSIEAVLAGKYPAKKHARKVASLLKQSNNVSSGVIFLESQKPRMFEDSDEEVPFRSVASLEQ
jgi:Xaa-Pro dipeptidase